MEGNAANQFNFVVGVFGFAITIASTALCCRAYLPGTQMKVLDELLKETRSIYEKADADDLFPSGDFREISLTRLAEMEEFGASLRERTYNATTVVQEYLALFKGLSRSIMQLSDSVKNLRACLISTSEKKRRRRQAENAGHAVHTSDSGTVDASMPWFTSIDPRVGSELNSRSQHVSHGSDRCRGRSASCPPALSKSSIQVDCLRGNLELVGECHSQGDASGVKIDSSIPETIDDLSRSSTLIDTQGGIFRETLSQFRRWTSVHPKEYILDAPEGDHDIARLPV